MKIVLTPEKPISEPVAIKGDAYVCIKGSGKAWIERRIGEDFDPMTTENGKKMVFVGTDEVLFNSVISCTKEIKHRFCADTTEKVTISIVGAK